MNSTTGMMHATERSQLEETFAVLITAMLMPLILVGNLLVMTSYKINHRLRTRTYTFLVNLAVSDLIVGGINIPLWLSCIINYDRCSSYKTFVKIFKIFDLFGAYASIFHLTAISIERYIAVVRPYSFQQLRQKSFYIVSVFAWSLSLLMASLSWFSASHFNLKIYNVAIFLLGFALPAAIVVSMYFGIFKAAKSLALRTPVFPQNGRKNQMIMREDRKVAVTVAVISGLFIIAWLPFFILSIIAAFCFECFPANATDTLRIVTSVKWLHYSNSMVNPIVYALRDEEMRNTFKKILKIKTCYGQLRNRSRKHSEKIISELRSLGKHSSPEEMDGEK
ncbi:muscarinic acetylcholine receptor M3-like [Actinia tenebrosa]|uniref:Muscarinic acetylcholine receptor M3-like n=1 Tax=Actinia tenebrosa TaxID=6105 RepID=A0A6P8IVJ1_ACTTE|nr:muscarinic acetylcholine receptor M3-like [Actinia tenebrosa]XP_031570993.1 muscarinic acetylcholine receptor M3-like [Actinia tenebrosa]XP_031570995.1 muscarinic acetylcholine receptor M3-like [Actinia tenebrosa]XP_031570996.1 muscarinic acetylcholine receptor M3-like [Actinia tenebrosa]XP_031570997.1 muscarinic acetylcholine receptor M3-like [Actinia tenebrosa]XP_031570998.1 muscarinic acetylcholine receptor M3-like [Actinia tenebrosa]